MYETLRGLPLRIPPEDAVRNVLSRGGNYRVNARENQALEISLHRVMISRASGHALEPLPESVARDLLSLALAAIGKTGDDARHQRRPRPTQSCGLSLSVGPRAARVLARVLLVRTRMRTEQGLL
jgi:hypothetical protein